VSSVYESIINIAIKEDLPQGDLTTDNLGLQDKVARARLVAKEDLVLSGTELFSATYAHLSSDIKIDWSFQDGQFVLAKQTICTLKGPAVPLLKGERVALNFLGRMSGIATLTRCFVEKVKHTKTKILDTRKTSPGLRLLEKTAVRHGGGENHRMNLSAAVLIKENHIRAAGGIRSTLEKFKKIARGPVEIEVRNLNEAQEALAGGANRLLLDNMTNEQIKEVLKIIPHNVTTEASGNMNLDSVSAVAELGVNFISVGAITHSAPCADVSLLFDEI
jgi:nicotinate-nucleotide pyrophosphorylase (carboxylating)